MYHHHHHHHLSLITLLGAGKLNTPHLREALPSARRVVRLQHTGFGHCHVMGAFHFLQFEAA